MPTGIYTRTKEYRDSVSTALREQWASGKRNGGWKLSEESRKHISLNNAQKGERHWNWKGGVMTENQKARRHSKLREWRKVVFERDDYRCYDCGSRGVYLHAHHIYSFAKYPRLRFMVENGRTLCKECHMKLTWG